MSEPGSERILELRSGEADVARKALERCVASGGVAVFPADGLYGLACDPLDAGAIARIHQLKGRDERQILGGHVLLAAGDARAASPGSARAPPPRSAPCCRGR